MTTTMFHIKDLFPSLGEAFERVSNKNKSATRKGPGRKHAQGFQKPKALTRRSRRGYR